MKETEKLDLLLKGLYESPDKSGDIVTILEKKGVPASLDDAYRLANRLDNLGYTTSAKTKEDVYLYIQSEGIEFVEGDSFTSKGHPVITNNYTITNSPNANQVTGSHHVTINQNNISEAKQILELIKGTISKDDTVDAIQRQDVIECAQEIEAGVNNGQKPKFAIKALLDIGSKVASISNFVIKLTEVLS